MEKDIIIGNIIIILKMYFLMALTKPVIEAMIILSARVGLHVFLFELWVGYCDLSTYLERSTAMTSFFTINKARLTCLQNTMGWPSAEPKTGNLSVH